MTGPNGVSLLAGVVAGCMLMMLSIALISVVVALTAWDDISVAVTVAQASAVIIGGFVSGRLAKRTGWLHGGLVGLFYRLLTVVSVGGGLGDLISVNFAWRGLLAFLAGAVGGMVGVNSTGNGRRT
ncbi:MAG TPA: TIGR04086 family membrane protein [Firmicutes bacterium]|jgi:putative membrane protein (TIGR04086 family)|nr:TIGR04086 family membrane protein [Bacillota bacterium]